MQKFVPEAVFEIDFFKTKLTQRPVNRFQGSWTLFLAKIMSQIDLAHSKAMNMHPGAVADPVGFFCTDPAFQKVGSDFDRVACEELNLKALNRNKSRTSPAGTEDER